VKKRRALINDGKTLVNGKAKSIIWALIAGSCKKEMYKYTYSKKIRFHGVLSEEF